MIAEGLLPWLYDIDGSARLLPGKEVSRFGVNDYVCDFGLGREAFGDT
jgi:hypothetical protein